MNESPSSDEFMAVIEHLKGVIAELKGFTFRELVIIAGYRAGATVEEIAKLAQCRQSVVTQTATRLRMRGVYLPRAPHARHRTPPNTHPRFTVSGVTDMGHWIEVTSDSQADSDAHLAAMVAPDG